MLAAGSVVTETTQTLGDRSRAAFDDAYGAARPRLIAICTGLVGTDAAEDVVQEVYLRGRSRFAQLRDQSAFDAWLARMAINLCYNRHRSWRRLVERLPLLASRVAAPATGDVGLRQLIERLPPRERTLVVLHYGYGYPIGEIAALLGLSPTNARSVLFRARTQLRRQLREEDQ